MLLVIGKIIEEKIKQFMCEVNHFMYETTEFIGSVKQHIKSNEEWRKHMSELANQLLAAVSNLAQGQSALSTSLGEYFSKVEALLLKVKDSDDDEIQQAISGINAAAASVNSDGTNLQAHLQALADQTGTPAPAEPIPTAPTTGETGTTPAPEGEGSTPAEGSGSTGTSSDETLPSDGSTAPEGEAGSTGETPAPEAAPEA